MNINYSWQWNYWVASPGFSYFGRRFWVCTVSLEVSYHFKNLTRIFLFILALLCRFGLIKFKIRRKSCRKCDTDFLMCFLRQFGCKSHQIRRKSHHCLSKCSGKSMTWPCPKSTSCFLHGKQMKPGNWHGIVIEFGVNLDQTAVDVWH